MLGTPQKHRRQDRRRYGYGGIQFFRSAGGLAAGSLRAPVHGVCPTDSASAPRREKYCGSSLDRLRHGGHTDYNEKSTGNLRGRAESVGNFNTGQARRDGRLNGCC